MRDHIDEALRVEGSPVGLPPYWPWLIVERENESHAEALAEVRTGLQELKDLALRGSRCPLSEARADGDRLTEMLTAPGSRPAAIRELRDFTREAQRLIVIDPYIYSGKKTEAEERAEEFAKAASMGKVLRDLHVVFDPERSTKRVRTQFKRAARERGVKVSEQESTEIHDRIWIADRRRGLVVGTSLGGLGGRLAFLLPLPQPDLQALLEFLGDRGLLP